MFTNMLPQPLISCARGQIGVEYTRPPIIAVMRCGVLGHTRLVTNGTQDTQENNQPVIAAQMVGIHNGIIVNDEDLWQRFPMLHRQYAVDTEILLRLIRHFHEQTGSIAKAVQMAYGEIEGVANIALLLEDFDQVVLASNNGSIHLLHCPNRAFIFASEEYALRMLVKQERLERLTGQYSIYQLQAGTGCLINLDDLVVQFFPLEPQALPATLMEKNGHHRNIEELVGATIRKPMACTLVSSAGTQTPAWVQTEYERNAGAIANLRRCTQCLLPETVPFIDLDESGVCYDCRHSKPLNYLGHDALMEAVEPYRRQDEKPECLVPISGGRDSCYNLHYIVRCLKLKPLAYTYDWGMVTDLARRNISRLCAKLGMEHILLSADIQRKRRNIHKNVQAWLRKPDMGIIPLFMAGDKQFYYFADRLQKQTGIDLLFFAMNALEDTDFKTGFCGISRGKGYDFPGANSSLQMNLYYARAFLRNPGYLNTSLIDTIFGYYSYYLMPIHKDYLTFFNYISWDEKVILEALINEYAWELATDTEATWRICDGTAPFYNYIYYTVAGFTECDTFRSNQIRAGMLTREEALALVNEENKPRYESMKWYCDTIDIDLDNAIRTINAIPKLYRV